MQTCVTFQLVIQFQFDQIKRFLLVEKIPPDVLTTLADKLPYDWKKFFRYLSVDDSIIEKVIEEFSTTREQTVQVLNHWRRKNPSKKWRQLKDGLIFCGRIDLVIECERSRSFELYKILFSKNSLIKLNKQIRIRIRKLDFFSFNF